MQYEEIKGNEKRGIIAGYKPNRISLYILLLNADRNEDLERILWNDMEKYKLDGLTQDDINL